ncbi:papain family cysteine protease (macronuclear) [Tetrahymena thermophila SB210]|uniref:Papain family cysteine protease n=1 Tax=Tetrahymena thermophila (strain SB210) TaxID=312017 RepID=Q23VA1_TETTS|nr:papain family cysteine protease [Tetrahymena thermophila SB210]EAS00457.1 papain family cysteine protease [Tetrahymena thermophila SB210]|eukprot:XP_001020702.1 papain family cysteine protease [Tetrahymena thermophila SB210]
MIQTLLFVSILSTCCFAQLVTHNNDNTSLSSVQIKDLLDFNKWKYQHGKKYFNADEANFRQLIYLMNLQKFNEHNSNPNNTYKVATNQFSDLSQEEFESLILNSALIKESKARILQNKDSNNNSNHTSSNTNNNNKNNSTNTNNNNNKNNSTSSSNSTNTINNNKTNPNPNPPVNQLKVVPQSVDWRIQGKVSPVKDQGRCGCCWAFSATALAESVNLMRNNTLQQYSEQELVDCTNNQYQEDYSSLGCGGGWAYNALVYMQRKGIFLESQYPYKAQNGVCNNATSASRQKAFFAKDQIIIDTSVNITNSLQYALSKQPVSVKVDSRYWNSYSSGVFSNCLSDGWYVDHVVLLVGYTKEGNWIVKNSWGTNWGQSGYIYLAPGNTCNLSVTPVITSI